MPQSHTVNQPTVSGGYPQGGIQEFWKKGSYNIKVWGVLSHFFLNIPLRPNYFIFIGYLKTGRGKGGSSEPPEPPLGLPLGIVRKRHRTLTAYCKQEDN